MFARFVFVCLVTFATTAEAHPDIDEVRSALEKEAPKHAGDPEFALRQARAHLIARDFDAALESIAHAEAHDADANVLHMVRGEVFFAADWPKSALRQFDLVVTDDPEHASARFMRARVLVKLGHPADAAPDYERALATMTRPKPEHFLEYRDAQLAAGDREGALAALSLGVERLGPIVSLQFPAIELDLELGNTTEALTRVDSLLAQSPENELWLARRGDVLTLAGRPEEARASYASALALLEKRPPRRRNHRVRKLEREIRAKTEEKNR